MARDRRPIPGASVRGLALEPRRLTSTTEALSAARGLSVEALMPSPEATSFPSAMDRGQLQKLVCVAYSLWRKDPTRPEIPARDIENAGLNSDVGVGVDATRALLAELSRRGFWSFADVETPDGPAPYVQLSPKTVDYFAQIERGEVKEMPESLGGDSSTSSSPPPLARVTFGASARRGRVSAEFIDIRGGSGNAELTAAQANALRAAKAGAKPQKTALSLARKWLKKHVLTDDIDLIAIV